MKPICLLLGLSIPLFAGCATQQDTPKVFDRADRIGLDPAPRHTNAESIGTAADRPALDHSLEDYIRFSLANNAGLRASFERWRASVERIPQAKALPNPTFTFTHFIEEIQTRTGPQENRIQLAQDFPWPTKLVRRGNVAEQHAEALWWQVESEALQLIRDVKVAYFEYAYLAQAIRIVEQSLTLLRDLEPIVQRRIQTGASQSELLRLQVEIGKVENELSTLAGRRPAINARLNALLDSETELPLPDSQSAHLRPVDPDALHRLLDESNPELRSLNFRIREAEQRTALSRLERYPDFSIGVGYIDTGAAVGFPKPSDSGDDPILVSFGISLPIWHKKYAAAEREARAAGRSAEAMRHQRLNNLQSDLEMLIYRFDDARRQISLYQNTLIPRGRQALEITEISYESGTSSLLDVIDAQRELLAFEMSYWRAVSDYNQRLAELEALCGGTLP